MPSVTVSDMPGSTSLPLLATCLLSLCLSLPLPLLALVPGLRRAVLGRRRLQGRQLPRRGRRRRGGRGRLRGHRVLRRPVPALRLAGARRVVADAVELPALVVLPDVDAAVLARAALDARQLLAVVVLEQVRPPVEV